MTSISCYLFFWCWLVSVVLICPVNLSTSEANLFNFSVNWDYLAEIFGEGGGGASTTLDEAPFLGDTFWFSSGTYFVLLTAQNSIFLNDESIFCLWHEVIALAIKLRRYVFPWLTIVAFSIKVLKYSFIFFCSYPCKRVNEALLAWLTWLFFLFNCSKTSFIFCLWIKCIKLKIFSWALFLFKVDIWSSFTTWSFKSFLRIILNLSNAIL